MVIANMMIMKIDDIFQEISKWKSIENASNTYPWHWYLKKNVNLIDFEYNYKWVPSSKIVVKNTSNRFRLKMKMKTKKYA